MMRGAAQLLNAEPAPCRPPIIFQPPITADALRGAHLTRNLELWLVTTGPRDEWGGAFVGWSEDGDTYHPVSFGPAIGPHATCGVLRDPLPAGASLDRIASLGIALDDEGILANATPAAAERLQTLCYLGDGRGRYELIAYSGARLVERTEERAHHYVLHGLMRRGAYGTRILDHPSGTRFARLDGAVCRIPFEERLGGCEVFCKVASLNACGDVESMEDPAIAEPLPVTLTPLAAGDSYSSGSRWP